MSFRRKLLISFVLIVALSQIPFAYRRYQLSLLAKNLSELTQEKIDISSKFRDYKGIIHAHTSLGGHSTGKFEELIKAAKTNQLDFVIMTEHTSEFFDSSALTLRGFVGNTLFINGQEVDTASSDRFLMLPGHADSFADAKLDTEQFIDKYKSQTRLILVAYPERLKTPQANFDGIEVFSLNTNAKRMNPFLFLFDYIWSASLNDLLLTKYFMRPDKNLKQYDELTEKRRLTLFAGSDAHSNIGFFLLGDDTGRRILYLKLDPYEKVFRLMRNHVLIEKDKELNQETLLQAIRDGRLYIGIDRWADPTGFSFMANEEKIMGDEITLEKVPLKLNVNSPFPARIILFRNGQKIAETEGKTANFEVMENGAYRVELYLEALGLNKMPWIISNPIYVR